MIKYSKIKSIIQKKLPMAKIGKMQYVSDIEKWIVDVYIAYIPTNLEILEAKTYAKKDIQQQQVIEDIKNICQDINKKLSGSFEEVSLEVENSRFFYPEPPKSLIKLYNDIFNIKTKKDLEEELDLVPERETVIMEDINKIDEGIYILHDGQKSIDECFELVRYIGIENKFKFILK